jgi:putative salt-induced outer membrane protein YdiY
LTSNVKTPSLIQININLASSSGAIDLTSLVNASKIRYKNGSNGTWSKWV